VSYKIERKNGRIWSTIRQKWLVETPEERVRQAYLGVLLDEYGYRPEQIAEEIDVTGRGSAGARADFAIWRTPQHKKDGKPPFIIVECKSNNVTIKEEDYRQGENYARYVGAPFFVTHNNRETRYWRVLKDKMPGYTEEIENIPHANDSDEQIKALLAKLKTFREDEFADLLHACHNIIRNREHLDPAAAFDEIAKILFMKVTQERRMRDLRQRENLFTADFLREQKKRYSSPVDNLFDETKKEYAEDKIFDSDARINLKFETTVEIVRKLERYDLSATSEDIKGIAFERFLGRTFRGEIGQFFTPRTIVEFMIQMVRPREGEVICDPASGSGGFLIRFFELVREQILADADQAYETEKALIKENGDLSDEEKAEAMREAYDAIQDDLDPTRRGSRLWTLANRCIYGMDANDRMARTSKMNMIMHGDGHGGVHHHNGFLNVNGIFEGRFDIILTNPPFGSKVEKTDRVTPHDVAITAEQRRRYERVYGAAYARARERTEAAVGEKIASLFDLGHSATTGNLLKQKTEVLFIERCLDLLKPGGRMGIVLPEGIFNNPSLQYVRTYCEDRARIRAVVSLPQETFNSAGATVKCSLLFVDKFTEEEKARYDAVEAEVRAEVEAAYAPEIESEHARLKAALKAAKEAGDAERAKKLHRERRDYDKQMAEEQEAEARHLLKRRFRYPVFLYDAEHVGITATGEPGPNELYPNDDLPPDLDAEDTCLSLYRAFCAGDADAFLLDEAADAPDDDDATAKGDARLDAEDAHAAEVTA
jgi:type I restriction enzyme M protein